MNQVYAQTCNYDILVDQNGNGDFTTIQEAIDHIPHFRKNETAVYINKGIYKEKLVLPVSKTNVTFIGDKDGEVRITYNDHAKTLNRYGEEVGTTGSTSFFIFANNFKARNITFENNAEAIAQAVAVRIDGDKVIFENCRFIGNQDTLYLHGKNSRQYFKDCYIEGTVDFIFGWSTAYFENCIIFCKSKGYITAASTEKDQPYGFVFQNCKITGHAEQNTVYLGRPWRPFAKTVWLNCEMDDLIKTEGWHNWNKPKAEATTFYAEFNTTGPGASKTRASWAKELLKSDIITYSKQHVLKGHDNWLIN
ncbi:pectinesterase [Maribacter sedimenticola]|uniref:Pectinesterase n=1 Tax=Maribacter sedimenticola TaxID=228956 RepID=A0ABY1SF26_9FLAO|nr:pectinesterase family protein [Maribacter sedimenticola]SNR31165.1 pectinesterase [Maribacter sedimenticola]